MVPNVTRFIVNCIDCRSAAFVGQTLKSKSNENPRYVTSYILLTEVCKVHRYIKLLVAYTVR